MTHAELVERASAWLSGSRKCCPVFTGMASASEIPDAIGWSSSWKWAGSIVVECKVSMSDFFRDKHKKHALRAGNRRYFLTPLNLVGGSMVEQHYSDHGLLFVDGRRIVVMREAPVRTNVNRAGEIRMLRFGLIHARDNLLKRGCTVDMRQLVKFRGQNGIILPAESPHA